MESDGSLLESVSADTALANEWSLPVLPEGNSSHPSSSQELADIFGTSDDEEDMDFPFGLSASLPVPKGFEDITLPEGNSLLSNSDSELFLAGFGQPGERGADNTKVSPQKRDTEKRKEEVSKVPSEPQEEKMETDVKVVNEQENSEAANEGTDDPSLQDSTKSTSGEQDGTSKAEAATKEQTTVRKSARIRARQSAPESSESSSELEPTPIKKESPEKPKPAKEEEPSTKESNGKNKEAKKEDTPPEQEGSSSESSSGDEDSEDEDPDKLYCICRQPHDDRFMICCDICEDWFHGNCVGITVAQGKRMEREGQDYVCPICVEKQMKSKEEAAANRSARLQQREVVREKAIKKKITAVHEMAEPPHTPTKRQRTISSSTPMEGDSYGLSQLFLPDNAPKGSEVSSTSEEKPDSSELLQYDCVIPDCPNKATPPSVYCSTECIEKHVSDSLKKLESRGVSLSSNPKEFVKGSGGITVVEKTTKKILVGICAPSEKELVPWLQAHPSYQVFIHSKGKKSKLKSTKVKTEAKKEEVKYPKIALMDPDSVRANAKKALYQILWKRCEEAADMSEVSQSEVEHIAHDIEEKLYNLNQDINPKYKNKYRSLIFNLKDMKNQGLFRKVLKKAVSSRELVRMSSEKLASEELSAWRESTLKKDLEMIKQREEEAGAMGEVIRKVTHKGEVEIDSSEIEEKIMESVSKEDAPEPVETEPGKSDTKSHSKPKPKSEPKTPDSSSKGSGGGILALLTNTTAEHGKHLYDHHCDICTGKMKPPTPAPSPPPSPDSRMHEDMDTDEPVEQPSPDSVAKPLSLPPHPDVNKAVWRGSVSMIGLTKFASTAYSVSGYTDDLFEHLKDSLELVGRIAYVQVWDYLDKIRSSGSRDIVVIRFDWLEDEKDAYLSMFNYLMRKHRSGVIVSGGQKTIKDMYLVPLPSHWDVPQQLLPFSGPGLPLNRGDLMLGVIVRSKTRRSSHHQPVSHPSPMTRIKAEVTLKRHHSSGDDSIPEGSHRKRSKVEVGFGDQTPPPSSKYPAETSAAKVKEDDDDDTPYSPSNMYEDSSPDLPESDKVKKEEPAQTVQMSFYGEHQPAVTEAPVQVASSAPTKPTTTTTTIMTKPSDINTSAVADSLRTALNLPPSANIQNILANLSSSKLKELASAVSSLEKISDGPIDQSTLAAAGTAKLRAAFGSGGPPPSSSQLGSVGVSVPSGGPPVKPHEPIQSQQHPPPEQVFPLAPGQGPHPPPAQGPPHPPPAQGPHPHQPREAHHHQVQGPPAQFRTEWDQRHQQQSYRSEPPPPPQPQQPQYNHPPQNEYQHPPANYPPEQHEYHQPPNQRDNPPPQSYPPQPPPPPHNDPSAYHPPHNQYPPHEWRDPPHPDWGQQHYQQHEPPGHEGWNQEEGFTSRGGHGFRGGFRGRGGHPERRGTWDNERYSEHGDRYRH